MALVLEEVAVSWLSSAWHWYSAPHTSTSGQITHPHAELVNPIGTFVGAVGAFVTAATLAWAAVRNARTASARHEEQTRTDQQRRITENFSKAIEQLGSDKLEIRVGGIHALQRIAKESPSEYWPIMENLTAFVRERTRRVEAERASQDLSERISRRAYFLWVEADKPEGRDEEFWYDAAIREEFGEPPLADIAAVIRFIQFRDHEREKANAWTLDLSGAYLQMARLGFTNFDRANLIAAHLEGADLWDCSLRGTALFRANLRWANLKNADLHEAHLDGADLTGARELTQAQIEQASGNAETKLPSGLTRPHHWN
jgi:uncharacterized protein YjbI with pentapeptide repeats